MSRADSIRILHYVNKWSEPFETREASTDLITTQSPDVFGLCSDLSVLERISELTQPPYVVAEQLKCLVYSSSNWQDYPHIVDTTHE